MIASELSRFDGKLIDGLHFCAMAYELFENIRATADGRSRLRMRAGPVEKKLIEELLPICAYVQAMYRAGRYISIKWLSGNQQVDAEVVQTGAYVDHGFFRANAHLEVTCVMHPNDYLGRELIDSGGVAFGVEGMKRDKKSRQIMSQPVVRHDRDFVDAFRVLVLGQIAKKASIRYPEDTTLIVQCSLNTLYAPDEWQALLDSIGSALPAHSFREIFIHDSVSNRWQVFLASTTSGE